MIYSTWGSGGSWGDAGYVWGPIGDIPPLVQGTSPGGKGEGYRPGDHLVICDRTGFTVWFSETRVEWNGLRVRKESWEPRHPQDFVRAVVDQQTVRDPRPDTEPVFVTTNQVTAEDL